MGEEAKQAEVKPEEKKEEKAEEKKEELKPPLPFVLFVDLHCMGCAKKIERSILKIRGVEGVVIDMLQNQVTIKGVVEPQAVCTKIMKKTKRRAQVLSPLPAAAEAAEPTPEVVASQVSGLITTVELIVKMHCEACALHLKRNILKMKGVRTAETDLSSGKVTVTGTMDANNLVDYVYRRTKKQAKIVPQPQPDNPQEEAKPEEKKEDQQNPAEESKPEPSTEEAAEKKDGVEKSPEEGNKEDGDGNNNGDNKATLEKSGENKEETNKEGDDEQTMQKMIYYYDQPLYSIEEIPPPQLFSDENPNACCVT